MTTGTLILLTLQGVIFAVWAGLMFRTLFLLARRARQDTGSAIVGPAQALKQWRRWLTAPDDRSARRLLGLVTALMLCLNIAFFLRQ